MTFKLIKDYIDAKLNEPHSEIYCNALQDLNTYLHKLETQNACHYCGAIDVTYPHSCNGFIATSRDVRVWEDPQAHRPYMHCHE